jgi:hypothetical protein
MTTGLGIKLPQGNSTDVEIASFRGQKSFRASRKVNFVLVMSAAIALAAIGSHLAASWAKITTTAAEAFTIGKSNGEPPAFLAGSSLASYGISWEQISTQLDMEIKTWGIAGSSPFEWELFQRKVPEARTTFIVVSPVELDEALLSDFRATVVPIGHTVNALRASHADWNYCKHTLEQYPVTWLRTLFPTLGRSRGLMGKLLIKVNNLMRPRSHTSETEAGPIITFRQPAADDEHQRQRISDWSESKITRKVLAMRLGFQGRQCFDGPKRLAFERMLRYGEQRSRTIVVVLPVSPAYARSFLPPETAQTFEDALTGLQQAAPRVQWLRLDKFPALSSADNFCDLDHLNLFGRQIATEALQAWLKQAGNQP